MKRCKRYRGRKKRLKRTVIVAVLFVLGAVLIQTASYAVDPGKIPIRSVLNLTRREADTSLGWNLILVNDDYTIPRDYKIELTELANGKKVDSRIYPQLQQMFDDARAAGLELFVREGYRTAQDQEQIMEERILDHNAYQYGFIKRYPSDKVNITGINNEPWHYRYVGKEAAQEIQQNGLCLEEYIDLIKG